MAGQCAEQDDRRRSFRHRQEKAGGCSEGSLGVAANPPGSLGGPAPPPQPWTSLTAVWGLSSPLEELVKLGKKGTWGPVSRGGGKGRGGSQGLELPDLDSHPELIMQGVGDPKNSALAFKHCLPAGRGRGRAKRDKTR